MGSSRIATRSVRITVEAEEGQFVAVVEVRRFGGEYRCVDRIGGLRLDLCTADLAGRTLTEVVRVVCERVAL